MPPRGAECERIRQLQTADNTDIFGSERGARILDSTMTPSVWSARLQGPQGSFDRLNIAGVESMADDKRDKGGSKNRASDEAALSARLRSLGERLGRDRVAEASRKRLRQTGLRSVGDGAWFPALHGTGGGVIVGALIGWLLDRWLGISPWGMIVFLLLGFAAGVLNVMRAAGIAPERTFRDGSGDKH